MFAIPNLINDCGVLLTETKTMNACWGIEYSYGTKTSPGHH